MAEVKPQRIYFKGSVEGVAKVRVRIHDANTEPKSSDPFEDFDVSQFNLEGDKYYLTVSEIDSLAGFEGTKDFAVSFVDAAGNESDMRDKDAAVFDQSPPEAPTEVGLE